MEIDIQKSVQEAIEKSTNNPNNFNKPIYEFVATYDAGSLTRYIGG